MAAWGSGASEALSEMFCAKETIAVLQPLPREIAERRMAGPFCVSKGVKATASRPGERLAWEPVL